jgi:maleate isomerase
MLKNVIMLVPDEGDFGYEIASMGQFFDSRAVRCTTVLVPGSGLMVDHDLRELGDTRILAARSRSAITGPSDIVVWACTSGSFVGGVGYAEAQRAEMEATLGCRFTSATLAFRHVPMLCGMSEAVVLGTYERELLDRFEAALGGFGVTVAESKAFNCVDAAACAAFDLVAILQHTATPSRLPVLVPDTAINSLTMILEDRLKDTRTVLPVNLLLAHDICSTLGLSVACLHPRIAAFLSGIRAGQADGALTPAR